MLAGPLGCGAAAALVPASVFADAGDSGAAGSVPAGEAGGALEPIPLDGPRRGGFLEGPRAVSFPKVAADRPQSGGRLPPAQVFCTRSPALRRAGPQFTQNNVAIHICCIS